jgi:hypothetical protein
LGAFPMGSVFKYASDWLGFGAAFTFAALTYSAFHFLDRNASGAAKQAITRLLTSDFHRSIDLQAALLAAFDYFYGKPLLGWRSYCRILVYSTLSVLIFNFWKIISIISSYHIPLNTLLYIPMPIWFYTIIFIINLIINATSDWISLIFIRYWIIMPKIGVIIHTFIGLFVAATFQIMIVVMLTLYLGILIVDGDLIESLDDLIEFCIHGNVLPPIFWITLIGPALVVILWIPLLGFAVLLNKLVQTLFTTTQWAQWFLKQGNQHPLP